MESDEENIEENVDDEMSNSLDGSDLDFDDEDYAESDNEENEANQTEKIKKEKIITKEEFLKLLKKCFNGNIFHIRKIIQLFTKINSQKIDTVDDDNVLNMPKYTNKLIKFYIKDLPDILVMKLNSVNDKNRKITTDEEAENFGDNSVASTKAIVKRYLTVLSKYIKDAELNQRTFIFQNLSNCSELVVIYSHFTEMFLKFFLKSWAGNYGKEASLTSFQTVKTILSKKPQTFETILKLMYINYLEVAKANSWSSIKKIKELQEDIINILSFDLSKAYLTIFTFIRKLCIQLRLTITEKRASSIKNIYNWQFVNSLILWTGAISKYSMEPFSEIKLLAYPLIQTIIGVIRLNLVDLFFPLRIILVNLLNKISYETEIFIPCESYILEILESSNFSRGFRNKIITDPHANEKERFDLNINLKIKKEFYSNYGNITYLLEEALDTLLEFCGANCYKISFPELGNIVNNYLKKISKTMKVKKIYL